MNREAAIMNETLLHYKLAFPASAQQLIAKLSKKFTVRLARRQQCRYSYYDSFDWRLYSAGCCCAFDADSAPPTMTLSDLNTGQVIAAQTVRKVPSFAWDLEAGPLRSKLESCLEMRALLPLLTMQLQRSQYNILNSDEKTVVRLVVEEYQELDVRITLLPVKGYDKALQRLVDRLNKLPEVKTARQTVLPEALQHIGRQPLDYTSKLDLPLDPEMRADQACKFIFQRLLEIMEANEAGVVADTDSEFLHDFRVAVRRTRSGLSQFKGVLDHDSIAPYRKFFAWLGQITSPTRDLDVYLLSFDHYKSSLPVSIREDLNPLRDFLRSKQRNAHRTLVRHLKSAKYRDTLKQWRQYLQEPLPEAPLPANALLPIKELADRRIWKVYRQVLKDGGAIDDASPAEDLHELRKTCKKLRYLMEFFQNLYPRKKIRALIKTLKGFQEVLSDFQDYQIQEQALKQFSNEMLQASTPAETFLAMGVLIQDLDRRSNDARSDFGSRFLEFNQPENQAAFRALFQSKARRRTP